MRMSIHMDGFSARISLKEAKLIRENALLGYVH